MSFSNTGESNINTGTVHVNVIAGHSGEDSSEDSNPIPHKALARMTTFFPTFHANHTLCKVSKHITALFNKLNKGLNIADAGADTHVVGNTWKPLFEVNDSTPRANVIGFDTNASPRKDLPIGAYVTKTVTSTGREIILRAKHAVSNATSPHTLLCTYQIRELGVIVDDVSKSHTADITGRKGTQSIRFKDGTIVDLKCRHTLMSFHTYIPTLQDIANLPIYDIAIEDWNPQRYYDGMNDDLSIMSCPDSGKHNGYNINSQVVTKSEFL